MLDVQRNSGGRQLPDKLRRAGLRGRVSGVLMAAALLLGLWAGMSGGCAAAGVESTAWQGGPEHGRTVMTDHYALHTTIEDAFFLRELAESMELSHELYTRLAPLSRKPRRLSGYVYAYRDEWAEYTEATAGALAPIYLQIHRGGYAHGDVF